MTPELTLLLAVLVPVLGALILPALGRLHTGLRNGAALAFVLVSLAGSLFLATHAFTGRTVTMGWYLPLGFNFVLVADRLAVFAAVVSSFISALIIIYSFAYISHYPNQNEYYLMVVLFLGAMVGLVFSGNLIFLFLFWEITAITSWRLIGFFRTPGDVLRADKAFLVTVLGSLLMLIGFIMLGAQAGSVDIPVIRSFLRAGPIPDLAVGLILAGILSKSATLPFHTWLPDAGVAPSPVTALLHAAILVKIGIYVFARLFVATIPLSTGWQTAVPIVAAASALVAACAALIDTDLKRIIAYSTISQIGFIFLGLATGTMVGVAGGLLYILMHGLSKAGLFLCAGIVEQNMHEKNITRLGGLIRTMPVTAVAFLFCAFSVMGIPPFGGFFCKYMVILGAMAAGQVWVALVFLGGALLTILYLFRTFALVFLGPPKLNPVREGAPVMVATVALLAVLSVAGGALIQYPNQIVAQTVSEMTAPAPGDLP